MVENCTTLSESTAFGYPWTPFRVEWRPTYGLDDRQTLIRAMDALQQAGVRAWWYSAAAKGSFPLFRSEFLPYRADADDALFQWLTEECHRRDISILSWEYLSTAPMLAAQEPGWRYRWFDHDGDSSDPREGQFVCYNSPYGDLLKDYCCEVVGRLGFDGIWFDGSTLHGVSTARNRIGCCCAYCQEKYETETGAKLPETIDLSDPAFRRYISWRYRDFTGYWAELSEFVYARHPDKLIAVNHFNRPGKGWDSGAPLWHTPMRAMISSEVGAKHNHLLLHHKIHRAINSNYPVEIWDYLRDGSSNRIRSCPEPDPAAPVYICQAAATMGGFTSFGLGAAPWHTVDCLTRLSEAVSPLAPYVGGEPWRCAGIVVSGATKDFAYGSEYRGWKQAHGAHNLLNALHIPSEVILDNMLDAAVLSRYQLLLLPDVQCLSDAAARALEDYVCGGGTLLATGELGTLDLSGGARDCGALDGLFGLVRRHGTELPPSVLDLLEPGDHFPHLPPSFLVSGACMPVDVAADSEALATVTYSSGPTGKQWGPEGLIAPQAAAMLTGTAIFAKNHGAGRAIWIRSDLCCGYAEQPNIRARRLVWGLVGDRVNRPFSTDAPPNVVIVPWQQGSRVAFHVLQVPSAMLRLCNERADQSDVFWPEDIPVLADFTIRIPGSWPRVVAPLEPDSVSVEQKGGALVLTIRRLHQHRLVVLE